MKKIVQKRHSFVAQVKKNQPELLKQIQLNTHVSTPVDTSTTTTCNDHGRYEQRRIDVYDDTYDIEKSWGMVRRVICVDATIKTPTGTSREKRCYTSNLESNAKTFGEIIRQHWRIENALHYVKDVAFMEDFSPIRSTQTPRVGSLL